MDYGRIGRADRAGGLKPRAMFHCLGLSALIACAGCGQIKQATKSSAQLEWEEMQQRQFARLDAVIECSQRRQALEKKADRLNAYAFDCYTTPWTDEVVAYITRDARRFEIVDGKEREIPRGQSGSHEALMAAMNRDPIRAFQLEPPSGRSDSRSTDPEEK